MYKVIQLQINTIIACGLTPVNARCCAN